MSPLPAQIPGVRRAILHSPQPIKKKTRGQVTVAAAAVIAFLVVLGAAWASDSQSAAPKTLRSGGTIPYFIAGGSGQPGYRASDKELARWAFEAWQRSAGKKLRFESANESGSLVRLYWAEASEGEYGEMQPLVVGGRQGAEVFIQPDTELLGEDIARLARSDPLLRDAIVYLTCLHEIGHALGLEHTRDFRDIMYYFGYGGDVAQYFSRYRALLHSRSDIAVVSGLSDGDVSRIRAMYP